MADVTTVEVLPETAGSIAEKHFGRCYVETSSEMCADDKPLFGTMGPWLGIKSTVDRLNPGRRGRVRDLDPADETNCGHGIFQGTYLGAFSAAARSIRRDVKSAI